jgi:tetratricopeptide (TPR) repeat protein
VLVTRLRMGLTLAVAGAMWLTPVYAQAPAASQTPATPAGAGGTERQWTDRAEYDLYNAITTATDPNVRLQKLNEWKEKYPKTNFDKERRTLSITTYAALNQPQKVIDAAKDMLQLDPADFTALYYITLVTPQLYSQTAAPPDALDQAQKAANSLLNGGLDKQFAPDKKPASMSDADYKKTRTDIEVAAHNTLGWIALQQKNNEEAEKQYRQALAMDPTSGQAAYLLGTAILAQHNPAKQSEGLYYIARSVAYDGPGALAADGRKTIDTTYLSKTYKQYHGSTDGLDQLKQQAKASATPPPGFTIESASSIAGKKQQAEEEEAKKNPALTMWKNLKDTLTGADGANYFNTGMKDTMLPVELTGKLISAEPAVKPKTLVLSILDGTTPDATLKFDTPLPGKVEPGATLSFKGIAESYTANPFMVTFKVDKENLKGWTGKAEAPVRKPPARRPAARKKAA